MAKVLVVDDERDYREQLEMILSHAGHETRSAGSGREAIDIGARFRPDVLVADWMLKGTIHGLHVSAALRVVWAGLRTILITGFASSDLRAEAAKAGLYGFVEKPFELDDIVEAVGLAVEAPDRPVTISPIGVLEVDAAGGIVYANRRARELFLDIEAGVDAASLAALFGDDAVPDLEAAIERWVVACPRARCRVNWHLRSQSPRGGGTRLVVLLLPEDPHHLSHQLIQMLLEIRDDRQHRWPFKDRVLAIDDDRLIRQLLRSMLEAAGAGGYVAETRAEALRLLETDRGIRYVVVDYEMPNVDLPELIKAMRAIRPDLEVVGSSAFERRAEFAAMGIHRFIFKPCRLGDLVAALAP